MYTPETQGSRREFLRASAAALAAASMTDLRAEDAEPSDPYGGFKIGLQSYSLRAFDVNRALQATEDLGLRYWESYSGHIPLNTLPEHVRKYRNLMEDHGVTLLAYGVVGFSSDENKAREIFDFAKAMALSSISANPDKTPETFDLLEKLVDEYDIPIAIHNHGPGATYDKVQDVVEMVRDRHPKIGACVDTGHYLRSDEDPVQAIRTFGERVFGVHLKDVRTVRDPDQIARLSRELTPGRVKQLRDEGKVFTVLGDGELDVVDCLRALREIRYEGCLALEYEENEQNPLPDVRQCLAVVRDAVKQLKA